MRKLFLIVVIIFAFCVQTQAHQRAKFDVVIDTDCGLDDFRAVTYFLASRYFNVNAITTVGGVLSSGSSSMYMHSLLEQYHHEGIRIGKGENAKDFRKNCAVADNSWSKIYQGSNNIICVDAVYKAIINNDKPTIYVALGPLTNLANLLKKNPEVAQKISYVVWSAEFKNGSVSGYNYDMDKQAFAEISSLNIPIRIISSESHYPADFLPQISNLNTVYAKTFVKFHEGLEIASIKFDDDIIPIYLLNPELFYINGNKGNVSFINPKSEDGFDVLAGTILTAGEFEKGVIINDFPKSGTVANDVAKIVDQIILAHGNVEYRLVLIASEMHSHLGIYSIIGVKMGLRILEYLHVGLDEIQIESYAGIKPPLSCLNDGIQIGAGTTIGYGAIVVNDEHLAPDVRVYYNGHQYIFRLKDSVKKEIEEDVNELVRKYGSDSDVYWSEIRKLSIQKYWLGKSRYDIFEIAGVIN